MTIKYCTHGVDDRAWYRISVNEAIRALGADGILALSDASRIKPSMNNDRTYLFIAWPDAHERTVSEGVAANGYDMGWVIGADATIAERLAAAGHTQETMQQPTTIPRGTSKIVTDYLYIDPEWLGYEPKRGHHIVYGNETFQFPLVITGVEEKGHGLIWAAEMGNTARTTPEEVAALDEAATPETLGSFLMNVQWTPTFEQFSELTGAPYEAFKGAVRANELSREHVELIECIFCQP